jgi:hypothetical protein
VSARNLDRKLANDSENDFAAEKKVLEEMATFSRALLRLPVVTDTVLLQVVGMMKQYADRCSRRCNMMLNGALNHAVIRMMLDEHRYSELRSAGRGLLRYMQTR